MTAPEFGSARLSIPAFSFVAVVSRRRGATENAEDVVYVMPYSVSQLYQAERVKTDAERRQADIEMGERAAEMSRLWQDLCRPLGALRRYREASSRRPVRRIDLASTER